MAKNVKKNQFQTELNETRRTLHKNLPFTAMEQYKLIRANLDFTLPQNEKCPVIGVTSSNRGEGKSTTSINLSYVLAEKGSRVLLIDGDLRLPSVAKKLEIDNAPGLSDLLRGKGAKMEQFKSHLMDNWYVLPSGDTPPNPSELLGSDRMAHVLRQLREMYDYIVVDLPPVNLVSDAISISKLIDGLIVVVRKDHTKKKELEDCIRQLELSNVKILGCVMNGVSTGSKKKYGYYYGANEEDTTR
jgi:capsular exopolysaccharide synthesis family protein